MTILNTLDHNCNDGCGVDNEVQHENLPKMTINVVLVAILENVFISMHISSNIDRSCYKNGMA